MPDCSIRLSRFLSGLSEVASLEIPVSSFEEIVLPFFPVLVVLFECPVRISCPKFLSGLIVLPDCPRKSRPVTSPAVKAGVTCGGRCCAPCWPHPPEWPQFRNRSLPSVCDPYRPGIFVALIILFWWQIRKSKFLSESEAAVTAEVRSDLG